MQKANSRLCSSLGWNLTQKGILPQKGGFAWFDSRGLNLTLADTGLLWERSLWFTVPEPQGGPFE